VLALSFHLLEEMSCQDGSDCVKRLMSIKIFCHQPGKGFLDDLDLLGKLILDNNVQSSMESDVG